MAYSTSPLAKWILLNPAKTSLTIICFAGTFGLIGNLNYGNNLFERSGALSVALGVLIFGVLASELLVRSQGSFLMEGDEPVAPFRFATVRKALSWQTFAIFIGTIQWGFGGLLFLEECTKC